MQGAAGHHAREKARGDEEDGKGKDGRVSPAGGPHRGRISARRS